jgi:transcriptional regulator with XRE-family HTH domain
MRIGERIAARRAELGLSQTQLAKAVGLSQATIGKLESGISSGSSHLHRFARVLHTTAEYLSGEMMTHPPGRCLLPHLSKSPNI